MASALTENRVRKIVREETDDMRQEIYRIAVMQEDTQEDVKTILEMLSDNLSVKTTVTDHDLRIAKLESDQSMLTETVTVHSRQLKRG